jgi:hypothetical protein
MSIIEIASTGRLSEETKGKRPTRFESEELSGRNS